MTDAMHADKTQARQGLTRQNMARQGLTRQGLTRQGMSPLLHAAFICIATQGVEQLTMRRVSVMANCALGTMTYHFASKQELLKCVFIEYVLPIMHIRATTHAQFDPATALREDIKASLPFDTDIEQVWRVRFALLNFSTSHPQFRALIQKTQHTAQRGLEKRYARLKSLNRLRGGATSRGLAIQTLLIVEGAGLNMLQAPHSQRALYGEQVLHWFDNLLA